MRHTRLILNYAEPRPEGMAEVEFTPLAANAAAQDLAEWLNKAGSMRVVRPSKSLPKPYTLEEFFEITRRGPNCPPNKFAIAGVWMDITGDGSTFAMFPPSELIGRLGIYLSMMRSQKEIAKVRRCARCKKWFAGKKSDRMYCSNSCRQTTFLDTNHWREYNRLYQKRRRAKQRMEKWQQRTVRDVPKPWEEFTKATTAFRAASRELERFKKGR